MKRAALIVAAITLPLLTAVPVVAQGISPAPEGAAPTGDATVATVNGDPITAAEIQSFYENLPPQYQQIPIEQLYPQLIERLIDQKLLAAAARKNGLDKKPETKKKLEMLTEGILQDAYLQEQIAPQVTEERLREEYQRRTALEPKREEVRARHILLKTREGAVAAISEIQAGGDFAQMAREKSTGPSSRNGGDLGFFTRDQMVKPFSEAAFALKAGEITTEPVQTQFGWHVIKVEERRMAGAQPFEEMAEELRQKLSEEAYAQTIQRLRANAKITTPGASKIQPVQ